MKVSHRMRKDIAYYHLPGLFEFMVLRQTACGAEVVQDLETVLHRKYWN